jgi:hypothetical protein
MKAMMIIAFLSAALANPATPASDPALQRCRPILARKAGGEIATIDVQSSTKHGGILTISGRLTTLQGMGSPAPGSAATHHLIRTDFNYRCRVSGRKVVSATVQPPR